MSKLMTLTVLMNGGPPPAGVTFDHVVVEVTDISGTQAPAVTLNGTESPPWTATLASPIADGAGTANIQNIDSTGAVIGTPIDEPFDTETAPAAQLASGATFTFADPPTGAGTTGTLSPSARAAAAAKAAPPKK